MTAKLNESSVLTVPATGRTLWRLPTWPLLLSFSPSCSHVVGGAAVRVTNCRGQLQTSRVPSGHGALVVNRNLGQDFTGQARDPTLLTAVQLYEWTGPGLNVSRFPRMCCMSVNLDSTPVIERRMPLICIHHRLWMGPRYHEHHP